MSALDGFTKLIKEPIAAAPPEEAHLAKIFGRKAAVRARSKGMTSSARGVTLVELMVAGVTAGIVVFFALATIGQVQSASASQRKEINLASQARLAMEVIGRDIRSAGDALHLLPAHCMMGAQSPGTPDGCAAILEPHPWRMTIARNAWSSPDPKVPSGTALDTLDPATAFDAKANNVVTYQFVPRLNLPPGGAGVLGRIERVTNPFGFGGSAPQVAILLDNVLLDDSMKVDPATGAADPRYDHALFLYRLMSAGPNEYAGATDIVGRSSTTGSFLLPPMRFFELPAPLNTALPQSETFPPNLFDLYGDLSPVGLGLDEEPEATLRQTSLGDAQDLRYALDYNRIRAVRIAFKVVEDRHDREFTTGVKLDDSPGTARVFPMEATFELKVFSSFLQ